MGTIQQLVTAEELLSRPGRCELIRGEVIEMSPAGGNHGEIAMHLAALLDAHVRANKLGKVFAAETGFLIERDPDTVRAPDVAFVGVARRAAMRGPGYLPGAPDLAAEVLSPDDRASEVFEKVHAWLAAGTTLVWVVDPRERTVAVYRRGAEQTVLTAADRLTGGDVLPGFDVAVAEIFAE